MGCYSWLDCRNKAKNIKSGLCYVLVPKEFGGGVLFDRQVWNDCYGHFDSADIWELVADWNKDYLCEDMLEAPTPREKFGGLWSFEIDALKAEGKTDAEIAELNEAEREKYYQLDQKRRNRVINAMKDFRSNKSNSYMVKHYGDEWKRDIGIAIACEDECNLRLPYPIKISYSKERPYEKCKASLGDPNQGC